MSAAAGRQQTRIFLVAGEPSGDALAARLMAALKRRAHGEVRFSGVGGPRMAAEGLDSLFPMEELSVMGATEVVPHLPRLMRRIGETARAAAGERPDAVITVDSPDFTFRVARRLKGKGIPLIHYVAPQVWAWKARRARHIAGFLDHLMALLPFEPPYFEAEGLACTYVGHPVIESGAARGDGPEFRARHGIPEEAPLLCLLPGSRRSEVRRLLPVFAEALRLLGALRSGLRAVVPSVDVLGEEIAAEVAGWPVPSEVVTGERERYDAFAAADVALAASGTVSLELAMAETPMVVAYRMHPLTGWLARRLVQTPSVNLVNLIIGRQVIPELLLGECRPDRLAAEVARLFDDGSARAAQLEAAREAIAALNSGPLTPSERAAEVVLSVIARRQPSR